MFAKYALSVNIDNKEAVRVYPFPGRCWLHLFRGRLGNMAIAKEILPMMFMTGF